MHKKLGFSLRISSVNETKYAGNCEFDRIYWKIVNRKLDFLYNVKTKPNSLFAN